jgi:hypothetical protein
MDLKWARSWFAATSLCVLAGVFIQLFVSADNPALFGGSPLNRALNIFAFFTVQSNLIVGFTCAMLVRRTNRTSTLFNVFRLTGIVAITVTFLVFHAVLSHLLDLDSWAQAANQLQHTVVPVMAVVGWLAFGPRGPTSARVAGLTVVFPALYMAFTMIRGPLSSHFYPYPFADVTALGYLRVIINGVWIGLVFVGVALGATVLDTRLSRSP